MEFYKGKKILVTGHTGFKGAWLTLWLNKLGAQVTGIALDPQNEKDIFNVAGISKICSDIRCDINDYESLRAFIEKIQPEIVFHLAAQSLVLRSYKEPLYTFNTNIIGTANLLEACRHIETIKAIVIITSDKCYRNNEQGRPFRENDILGGNDPYSASKAGAEMVVTAYRKSFYNDKLSPGIATARGGNVIGGGDWAENRIVPDIITALIKQENLIIRNPDSVRPWQFVLEPLYGYLQLGEKLAGNGGKYGEAYNFGPDSKRLYSVIDLTRQMLKEWGDHGISVTEITQCERKKEAQNLVLDSTKAMKKLNWRIKLSFEESVRLTAGWYRALFDGKNMYDCSLDQINYYESLQHDN